MSMKTMFETSESDEVLRDVAKEMLHRTETAFADVFRSAQDAGQIAPNKDPDVLASRLQAEIFGLRAYAQRSDAKARIADLADATATDLGALAS